jgi:hypothetical protein
MVCGRHHHYSVAGERRIVALLARRAFRINGLGWSATFAHVLCYCGELAGIGHKPFVFSTNPRLPKFNV